MNEGLTKLTATPKEVMMGDSKEMLYPLRFFEWGKLEQWMRSQIIAAAQATIKTLERKEAVIVMKTAHQVAAQVSILKCLRDSTGGTDETHAYLRSFEGMLRTLSLSLRESAARDSGYKYTLLQLDEMISGDVALLTLLFLDIMDISFPTPKEEDSEKNLPAVEQEK